MAKGDQALAAEPGFHGDPPRSGGWEVTALRRLSGHYSELMEQQPENGLALAQGPTQALRLVMKDGAGGAAVEAAARLVIEFVGGNSTLRSSGDPLFPDNASTYIQPRGSTALFFNYGGSSWRFNAVSVDLALYGSSSLDPVTVQFTASGYSRTTDILATTEFTISGAVDNQGRPLFQTFFFPPEFNGLSGMYYLSITPTATLWSLDNLVVSQVPEPSVPALLLIGGLVLAATRARIRAKH